VEEVGNTKAIGYSKEDEEKKKMHRDVSRTCHTANTGRKESVCTFFKFSKHANYKCHKLCEEQHNEFSLSN